jgi:hypothetical protein
MKTTSFYRQLYKEIDQLGGVHNAHLHLDRANTLDDGFVDHGKLKVLESSHISLQKKHSLIESVHEGPAYEADNLTARFDEIVTDLIDCNTVLADTMVDVCADRCQTDIISLLQAEKQKFADKIKIRCAAYSPFGFRDSDPAMWHTFEQGAQQADLIGALPEADDVDDYPDHIGFEEHCVRTLDLAKRQQKLLHVHTDQRNEPTESGTERLVEVIKKEGSLADINGENAVWAVHLISPSTYDDKRFYKLVDGMLETKVGIICCPSAALGMRQYRPVMTPTYNSFPRLLEMAVAGIPIRLGSDNIADMCSPSTTADIVDEVFVLSAALRFYNIKILAKFACGAELDSDDRAFIQQHLYKNDKEIGKFLNKKQLT